MTGAELIIGFIIGMGVWVSGLTFVVIKHIQDNDDTDFE